MERITAGMMQARGQAEAQQRQRLRALNDAIAAQRAAGSNAPALSPQQLQQRRRLLSRLRPQREQLSQAELRNMGPVKMLGVLDNATGVGLPHFGSPPSGDGVPPSSLPPEGFGEEEDALADSAEQEALLKLIAEEKKKEEAAAARQKALALERELFFGPADGEEPRPFPEISGTTAVGLYGHLERRARLLDKALQQSRAAAATNASSAGGLGGGADSPLPTASSSTVTVTAKAAREQQQQQQQRYEAALLSSPWGRNATNPTVVLDRCEAALAASAPLVTQTAFARNAETGAVIGKVGQPYASREQQLEAEAAVIRKVAGLVGSTVGVTVIVGPSVLRHLCAVADIAAAANGAEEERLCAAADTANAHNASSCSIAQHHSVNQHPNMYSTAATASGGGDSPTHRNNGDTTMGYYSPTSGGSALMLSHTVMSSSYAHPPPSAAIADPNNNTTTHNFLTAADQDTSLSLRPITPTAAMARAVGGVVGGIEMGGAMSLGLGSGLTTLQSVPPPLLSRGRGGAAGALGTIAGGGPIKDRLVPPGGSVSAASGVTSATGSSAQQKRSYSPPSVGPTTGGTIASVRRASLASHVSSSSPQSVATTTATALRGGGGGGALPTVRATVLNHVRQTMGYEELLAFNALQATPGTIHNSVEHRGLRGHNPAAAAATAAAERAARSAVGPNYFADFFSPDLDAYKNEPLVGGSGDGSGSGGRGVGWGPRSSSPKSLPLSPLKVSASASNSSSPSPLPMSLGTVRLPAGATVHQALAIVFLRLLMLRAALGLYRTVVGPDEEDDAAAGHLSSGGLAAGCSADGGDFAIPTALRDALAYELYGSGGMNGASECGGGDAHPIRPSFVSFLAPNSPFVGASDHPLCALFASLRLAIAPAASANAAEHTNAVGGAEALAGPRLTSLYGEPDTRPRSGALLGPLPAGGVGGRKGGGGGGKGSSSTTDSSPATHFVEHNDKLALARVVPEAINGANAAGSPSSPFAPNASGSPTPMPQHMLGLMGASPSMALMGADPSAIASIASAASPFLLSSSSNATMAGSHQQQQMQQQQVPTPAHYSALLPAYAPHQYSEDLAIVVAAVTATTEPTAREARQQRLALGLGGGGREGKGALSSSSLGTSRGVASRGATPQPAGAVAAAASPAAVAAAAAAEQQRALNRLASSDPLSLAAIAHLLSCGTATLLGTGYFATVPSSWRPPTSLAAAGFVAPLAAGTASGGGRRGGARPNANALSSFAGSPNSKGGLGGTVLIGPTGVPFSFGAPSSSSAVVVPPPNRLIGIHQQTNAQRFHLTPAEARRAALRAQRAAEQQQLEGSELDTFSVGSGSGSLRSPTNSPSSNNNKGGEEKGGASGGDFPSPPALPSFGALVDPYHNPATVPMAVTIASRPLLRTLLRKFLSHANKQAAAREAANVAAASRRRAMEAALLRSVSGGGSAGGARGGGGGIVLTPLNTYPVTAGTAELLQAERQRSIAAMRAAQQQQHLSGGGGGGSSPLGGASNDSPMATTKLPKPIAKILPESALVAALSPPYALSVEVAPAAEALFAVQAAEARHRRLLMRRYFGVAAPYFAAYHHHCVLLEGSLRQCLLEMEDAAWDAVAASAVESRRAAERAALERAEEAAREEVFEGPSDRVGRHLWPMLWERLGLANACFVSIARDVTGREAAAFAAHFADPFAPYSSHQFKALTALCRQRAAFAQSCAADAAALEEASLAARRRLLDEAAVAAVRSRRTAAHAAGADRTAVSLVADETL